MGPPLVLPEKPEKLSNTTILIWTVLSGQDFSDAPARPFVDVRDVARLHVFGIEHGDKANGQRYLTIGGVSSGQAVADILNKHYPQRKGVIKVGHPGQGDPSDYKTTAAGGISFDTSKAVKATGQDWIGFEQTVLDAAKVFERYL
jgi:nucleoside-diphosphate-sugar epimerase